MAYPTREDLVELSEGNSTEGFCTWCEEWTLDSIDPNESNDECPNCNQFACCGVNYLLENEMWD